MEPTSSQGNCLKTQKLPLSGATLHDRGVMFQGGTRASSENAVLGGTWTTQLYTLRRGIERTDASLGIGLEAIYRQRAKCARTDL
jgi:hypothetical protein